MSIAIIFLPLLSGIICGLFNKILSHKTATLIAVSALSIAAILAVKLIFYVHSGPHILHEKLALWMSFSEVKIYWAIYIDELTAVMLCVVTIVSAIVHIYSYGYMHDDENLPRFMSYLSLFTFFMLALVTSDNFLQLFFGWEGVGLCSYLLIGFWYKKEAASKAAIKAFVVNRVGDFSFILGIIAIIYYTGSTDFYKVFTHGEFLKTLTIELVGYQVNVLEMICFLLFVGCMGKSAQIGLHIWLPDAMEGPTPVSALIHAATMVTAGVFLLGRCSSLFMLAPITSQIILYIGAITCLFAATTAIAQTDIKKIIAYSTCSQLGYMFMACGSLAYSAGIFHLVTHAFFKAMLFLAAGIVIHAVHEQDIYKMGKLYKKMPITYIFFWLGSLAIMGIYPFAGYYSKDLILESVFLSGAKGPFAVGIIAAFFTALYSMKILIMVFHTPYTDTKHLSEHKEENISHNYEPTVMIAPLIILALGSIFAGSQLIDYFTVPSIHEHHLPFAVHYAPLIAGISGMISGILLYKFSLATRLAKIFAYIHKLFQNKYFFDEIYEIIFVRPASIFSRFTKIFDNHVVDNIGPGASIEIVGASAKIISSLQSGYIYTYVFSILLGVIGIMTYWIIHIYL